MIEIKIKPLSINECFQGKRFKTKKYKDYECNLLWLLPKFNIPDPPLSVYYEFGFSSSASDVDNGIKPFQDVLQKKYKFNDKDIFELVARKIKVPKGKEYIKFEINKLSNNL